MIKTRLTVQPTPSLLRWARETAGFSPEEVSRKLDITSDRLVELESGDILPSLAKLREFSNLYKRSLAVFFLPEPPPSPPLPKDFRTLPSEIEMPLSPKSFKLIRSARLLQSNANSMASDLELSIASARKSFRQNDPAGLALKIRKEFEVSIANQFQWRDSNEAFSNWRSFIEKKDILVFQLPLPVNEIRGFTLYGAGFPCIVISSGDSVNARIFTLFHEYAHILIGREGMCLPEYKDDTHTEAGEVFCNHFAGAFLVPAESLLSLLDGSINIELIKGLALKFKVSKYVILRRLQILNRISLREYRELFELFQRQEKKFAKSRGGPAMSVRCVAQRGRRYVSMVFDSMSKGVITLRDASSYLGVKTKYFREVAALAMR